MRTTFLTLALAGLAVAAPCPRADNSLAIGSNNDNNSILSGLLSPSVLSGNSADGNGDILSPSADGSVNGNDAGTINGNSGNGNGNTATANGNGSGNSAGNSSANKNVLGSILKSLKLSQRDLALGSDNDGNDILSGLLSPDILSGNSADDNSGILSPSADGSGNNNDAGTINGNQDNGNGNTATANGNGSGNVAGNGSANGNILGSLLAALKNQKRDTSIGSGNSGNSILSGLLSPDILSGNSASGNEGVLSPSADGSGNGNNAGTINGNTGNGNGNSASADGNGSKNSAGNGSANGNTLGSMLSKLVSP